MDGGSPDGTAGLVRQVVARGPAVELLSRPGKLGLASADQTALRRVLDENRDDCVVTMDADFSHHPRYVPPLVDAAAAYGLVIGSRYVGGGIDNWDARRRLLSLIGNWYARTVTGTPVRDLTAGLTCMRTDFLRTVPFESIEARAMPGSSPSRRSSTSAAPASSRSRFAHRAPLRALQALEEHRLRRAGGALADSPPIPHVAPPLRPSAGQAHGEPLKTTRV